MSKPISPKRRALMAKTALRKYASGELWGAVECAIASQFCYSLMHAALKEKTAREDLKALAADTLPLLGHAAREPFLPYVSRTKNPLTTDNVGDDLIAASADVCIYSKGLVFDGPVNPLAYLYTVYLWLETLLERGPERGGLVLGPGSPFDVAWQRIAQEMLRFEDDLQSMERSCRKRARRLQEAFEQFGLFVAPDMAEAA